LQLEALPILAVCGASGSGKTTLIEQTIPQLLARGLKVAVAKQSPKPLVIDQAGKDSARFFAAGVDCLLMGTEGLFARRQPAAGQTLQAELRALAEGHDLVLVEGYRHTPLPKVWLLADQDRAGVSEPLTIATLARGDERPFAMAAIVDAFLSRQWLRPPVLGCLLIGGKSTRMGRPKHLLLKDGETWLARTARTLAQVCDLVVVVGQGEVGPCALPRLSDVPGINGPLAGLLAAHRWQPWATVLACACDLPDLSLPALRWLLAQRSPGAWAVIPNLGEFHEPLLALYDFRIRKALEVMADRGDLRLANLVGSHGVRVVSPPQALHKAWRNVNYPEMV
jgi:molybdopterin-guanine dinucleotide biosynthesis protein MobB